MTGMGARERESTAPTESVPLVEKGEVASTLNVVETKLLKEMHVLLLKNEGFQVKIHCLFEALTAPGNRKGWERLSAAAVHPSAVNNHSRKNL